MYIRLSGYDFKETIRVIKEFKKTASNIINRGMNVYNINKKLHTELKKLIKRKGFNEKGERSEAILDVYSIKILNTVNNTNDLNKKYTLLKNGNSLKKSFINKSKYKTWKIDLKTIINFMDYGRKRYVIRPENPRGILKIKISPSPDLKFKIVRKPEIKVKKFEPKIDKTFDDVSNDVINNIINVLRSRIDKAYEDFKRKI